MTYENKPVQRVSVAISVRSCPIMPGLIERYQLYALNDVQELWDVRVEKEMDYFLHGAYVMNFVYISRRQYGYGVWERKATTTKWNNCCTCHVTGLLSDDGLWACGLSSMATTTFWILKYIRKYIYSLTVDLWQFTFSFNIRLCCWVSLWRNRSVH